MASGQADDWLNFGPITIPSTGAQLKGSINLETIIREMRIE